MDRVQQVAPTARGPRLLMRLGLFAFCAGLLLLLSSRPADAAERREPQLLDPVGTTLKATAREVDSFAGRATGSGSSTVARTVDAARQAVAPPPRPAEAVERREPGLLDPVRTTLKATAREVDSFAGRATGSGSSTVGQVANAARHAVAPQPRPAARAARSALPPTVKRGGPAVHSPVRRAAPPTASPRRTVRSAATPVDSHGNPARWSARLPLRGAEPGAGSLQGVLAPVVGLTGPVVRPLGPVLVPVGSALAPVGSALVPVGAALAPITGPVAGLLPPLVPGGLLPVPGLSGPGNDLPGGSATRGSAVPFAGAAGSGDAGLASNDFQTYPARPAADGASSPATRSIRSWPALTGAVSLPGFPASAELPAGGPDPQSSSSGAGSALAALAAALLLFGLPGRGRARPDRSGVLSRSYLPLVSPA